MLEPIRFELAPALENAICVGSEGNRHDYRFDATKISIQALLAQAAAKTEIIDVETHRAPIDEVFADIYEQWEKKK